jgi:DNA-binding response OmpR family regulator
MKQLVFVVDGAVEVCHQAKQCLERAGYAVQTFFSANILSEIESQRPCLVSVAMMLPDGNGLELCRRIRENPVLARTPVVFLIDEDAEEHRVLALESGGDDCLLKPFSPRELVARIQAVLRRFGPRQQVPRPQAADLVIDSAAMRLHVRGAEVPTTTLEFRLIEYLARHRGQVFTRDVLLDSVWGDMQFVTPRSVDACVRRIREKIEPNQNAPTYLKTVRGVGYRLDAAAVWQISPSEGCGCAACLRSGAQSRPAAIADTPYQKSTHGSTTLTRESARGRNRKDVPSNGAENRSSTSRTVANSA